ncbi:XdhC family protein [Halomarina ordinaria]|uniref:XdhC family protein n=1 Tax=Halomarina ordinaria TaxID=3033939 RepID=A0ABD5U8N5_9EURY|nr:XdhC/CoxI family protein [Halomarina sp. PSRA2]
MTTNDWSVPETDVFERIRTVLDAGSEAVLATVVAVEGSAYRRPGAKMLVDPAGGGAGSITAGCLEDEVRELAADVLAAGEPRTETWDLTGDDDVWGMGVGCNGVITVLLEPLTESYRTVAAARERGEDVGVAAVVGGDLPLGARAVYRPGRGFDADGDGGEDDLPAWLREAVADPLDRLLERGASETVTLEGEEGTVEVFLDAVTAPPELVVFGAGHDTGPVVELATLVDFRVTVVTFRGGRAGRDRYPRADEVVSAAPRDVATLREWDDDTYAVVMTHNFVDDRLTLAELLETPVAYVGLMGPEKRFREMREALAEEGVELTPADLERVYTPIGLNLGGDTPYRIAYSIVAELLAVANDRTPDHLGRSRGPIHDRVDVSTD